MAEDRFRWLTEPPRTTTGKIVWLVASTALIVALGLVGAKIVSPADGAEATPHATTNSDALSF